MKSNLPTDAEIDAALLKAKYQLQPHRCIDLSYDHTNSLVVLHFPQGVTYSVPQELIQGVANMSPSEITDVEIWQGEYLHWNQFDLDLTVQGLLIGVYGTKSWMDQLATK